MASIAAWLIALVGPLARKVLLSLGIGWVSYVGFDALLNQVRDAVSTQWGQLGGATLAIIELGGGGEAIGIVLGALAAKVALTAVERLGKVAT